MKKIILAILAILVFGGASLAIKIMIDRPSDPQNFVNTALVNSLKIDSAKFESTIRISANVGEIGNGQFALAASGSVANATEYLPTVDYQIDLETIVNFLDQAIQGKMSGKLKIIDEVFYGKIDELTIDGADELNLPTEAVEEFVGKWYAISFAKLKAADPEIAAVFEEQKTLQLAMSESLKNIFATSNILLVKKMPISFGDSQPVEVFLNTDFLASDAFLTELEKILIPASLAENEENPFAITDEQKAEMRKTLTEIGSKIDSTITLNIGKKDGILHGYTAVVNFDLVELGLSQIPTGEVSIVLDSKVTEVNQPQTFEAPTDFEEIDPLEFVPIPTDNVENETEAIEEEDENAETIE